MRKGTCLVLIFIYIILNFALWWLAFNNIENIDQRVQLMEEVLNQNVMLDD